MRRCMYPSCVYAVLNPCSACCLGFVWASACRDLPTLWFAHTVHTLSTRTHAASAPCPLRCRSALLQRGHTSVER